MNITSTMGWNHIAIKRRGLRGIWLRDGSDTYIIYLDNTTDPETCRITKMCNCADTGVGEGANTLTKEDAQGLIERLGDGSGLYDKNLNLMQEYQHEIFKLEDHMPRIHEAMKHYKGRGE
jgi:hypothetical protein